MNWRINWTLVTRELRREDRLQHIKWSFWLLIAALCLLPAPAALLTVFLIGLVKEVWDARYGSGFCMYDMLGNGLGMVAAIAVGLPVTWLLAP